MMVVTVMAVALHLFKSYWETPSGVNLQLSPASINASLLCISNRLLHCLCGAAVFMKQVDYVLIEAIAQVEALGCARNIAHLDFDARGRRPQIHHWSRIEPAQPPSPCVPRFHSSSALREFSSVSLSATS